MVTGIGRGFLNTVAEIGSLAHMLLDTGSEMLDRMSVRFLPFRSRLFFEQTARTGVGSIPLVAMVSLFLGISTTLLTGYQLARFGAEGLVPGLVAVSFTRELGALLTGIVTAARSGAAFTAELSTMVVSDEVAAIETMGIGPLRYLVAPRILASIVMLPCLTVVSNVSALLGSAWISGLQLGILPSTFYDSVYASLALHDIWSGILKSLLFGFLIGLIACHKGLRVKGGAQEVGKATRSSVVTSISIVIACDMFVNVVFVRFFP